MKYHLPIAVVDSTSQTHCACAEYGSGNFMQNIQSAFTTSSAALLQLLQQELGLNRTLAALKHYFLLDQGDLLVSFLDTAEEELSKPASQVSVIRLQSLLDLGKPTRAPYYVTITPLLRYYYLRGHLLVHLAECIPGSGTSLFPLSSLINPR